jgi:hypothetical protein
MYAPDAQSASINLPLRPLANPGLAGQAGVVNKYHKGSYYTAVDLSTITAAGRKEFLAGSLAEALKKANLNLADLDRVIAQHIGDLESTWTRGLVEAGLSADKYQNLRKKYGNMGAADQGVDLAELWTEGQLKKNDIIALWAVSEGVQTAALVVKWLK